MKESRIKHKLTLRKLSEKTGIKLSRLSDLEQARAVPTSDEAGKIAHVLGPGIKFADSETAEKENAKFEAMISNINKVYEEIKHRGLGKGNGGNGTMPCPKCGKSLGFSVASINGHVWAKCSTKNCLAWIQ